MTERVRISGPGVTKDTPAPGTPVVFDMNTAAEFVPAGVTATLSVRYKACAFRFTGIQIHRAEQWMVDDVMIGDRSQFKQPGRVPADTIDIPDLLHHDPCGIHEMFSIAVTYVGEVAGGERVTLAVIGDACGEPSS